MSATPTTGLVIEKICTRVSRAIGLWFSRSASPKALKYTSRLFCHTSADTPTSFWPCTRLRNASSIAVVSMRSGSDAMAGVATGTAAGAGVAGFTSAAATVIPVARAKPAAHIARRFITCSSWMGHGQDTVTGVQRRHGHPELASPGECVAQGFFVLEAAAAQHVLLRRHAVFWRGVEEFLADATDDFHGLCVAGVHDAGHRQRRHVTELDLHGRCELRRFAHDAH